VSSVSDDKEEDDSAWSVIPVVISAAMSGNHVWMALTVESNCCRGTYLSMI
jgi:hypothetical protein